MIYKLAACGSTSPAETAAPTKTQAPIQPKDTIAVLAVQHNLPPKEEVSKLHLERMMDTYVLAGIGLAGPPNAEMDGKQMEEKFKQMGKTDMEFNFYPGVDHNIPEEFYETANDLMLSMRGSSKIVNPIVQANITEK